MTDRKVSIDLQYDADFQKSVVERERADPLVGATVRVDGTYVLGDEDHTSSGYMTTNLTVHLEAIEKILANEKAVIEYANGPMWLVVEPHDEETIKITGCATFEGVRDPDQRLSVDTSAFVSKMAWISEVIRTADQFYEKVVELNPALEDDQILQGLRTAIADANKRLEALEAE